MTLNGVIPPKSVHVGQLRHSGNNKKLSYPQRKCASNVAIPYGADGISI